MNTPESVVGAGAPRNLEAEQAVLGSILLENGAFEAVHTLLGPEDFYSPAHRRVFEAIHSLLDEELGADLVTVTARCRHRGTLEVVGGPDALMELLERTPSAANAEHYASLVADAATRRRAIAAASEVTRLASDPTSRPEELSAAMERLALGADTPSDAAPEPVTRRLNAVEPRELAWLWPGRVPLGKLTLLVGDPGRGKSLLTLDMAARVTRGLPWPDAPAVGAPEGNVVLLSAEDDAADTIRPRLEAADGDPARVVELRAVRCPGEPEGRGFQLGTDLAALERAIEETRDVRLIILDPLSAYLGGLDTHNNAEVRTILAPLAALAERSGAAVVAVTHLNKNAAASFLYRATGSLAFVAAARAVWAVLPDESDPHRQLVLRVKCNLAGDIAGLAYRVEDHPERPGVPVLAWERDTVPLSAVDALAGALGTPSGQADRASGWLRDLLADGPVAVQEVEEQAREAGLSRGALARAKKALGVVSGSLQARGAWFCRLPGQARQQELPMSTSLANLTAP